MLRKGFVMPEGGTVPYSHHGQTTREVGVREEGLTEGYASSDADETFWAQLSGEAPGVIEVIQDQGCEVQSGSGACSSTTT
jgi:hypothetical protein